MTKEFNILIDLVGLFLVVAMLFTERVKKNGDVPFNDRLLHNLNICCMMVFVTDILGVMLDGITLLGARNWLWFFDSLYWLLQIVYCYLWLLFADNWTHGTKKRWPLRRYIYAIPMLIEILLIITTPLTGWIFTINEQNFYQRGTFYHINMVPYCGYIIAALIITVAGSIKTRTNEYNWRKLTLVLYMFLPIMGVIMDFFIYGISWLWPMVALSLFMVYLDTKRQQTVEIQIAESQRIAQLAKIENELLENRMAIMLSQIQPHFLYNAMSTIIALCHRDPPTAEIAMKDLTEFLKGNMNSLTAQKPIPFEKELEHTKNYLAIEKLRFQDSLNIVYDIQTTRFSLPTLTLQPLVENAVRYGVTKREDGGTVTIKTMDDDRFFYVIVSDDGVGFDVMISRDDGRTHIGISNVKNRIEKMCGGSLSVDSVLDVGTVAKITIPKD